MISIAIHRKVEEPKDRRLANEDQLDSSPMAVTVQEAVSRIVAAVDNPLLSGPAT